MENKNRVGEQFITNEGCFIEIIQYFNSRNCTIQFEDGNVIKNKGYGDIKRGSIKNPLHKSLYGVGYFGIGKYNIQNSLKVYNTWKNILERCYNSKCKERNPTYKDCYISNLWCNFQNFAKWFDENYTENFHLDKDILQKGNKIYSPETCCFVPQEINSLLLKSNRARGEYPIGVSRFKSKFNSKINIRGKGINLGTFDTPEEAFCAYKTAKEEHIKEMAEEWKDKIDPKVYQAMYNYKVEITD